MARDIAQSFNYRYKKDSQSSNNKTGDMYFTLPEAQIDEAVATLPGLDGRKMSKSYDNTIPLFASKAELKKLIAGIVTDSKLPGEAKDTEGSALFQIYQAFATDVETQAMRQAFKEGISWGDAKLKLLERIDQEIAPMRETYASLISNPDKVETILLAGADKARKIATPFMQSLREAVGLRRLHAVQSIKTDKKAKQASFAFKQYREPDGKFYFKLVDASNSVVLQSQGFDTPKEAGQTIAWLKENGLNSLPANVHFVNEIPQSELGELNLQLKNSWFMN